MIKVKMITPVGLYLETEAEAIHVKTVDGERTLLPNHMPIVAMLTTSRLQLKMKGEYHDYAIAGGMLQLLDNDCRILCDAIEGQPEIDLKRAEEAKRRAEERLHKQDSETNMVRAQIALEKAINRLNVGEK